MDWPWAQSILQTLPQNCLTPLSILNSGFYRNGPIDYMRSDSYVHIFLQVSKNGEQYSPPPNELLVVFNEYCTVCKIPEMCLVFVATVARRIQPNRACKQKFDPQLKQQLHPPNAVQISWLGNQF